MKNTVYKIKNDIDINEFGKIGYDIMPNSSYTVFKFVEQPIDGKLAQDALQYIYENPSWKEKIYKKNKSAIRETLGLRFNRRTGKAIINEKFKNVLIMWRIEIEMNGDRWVGFTSLDQFDSNVFYGKQVIDEYCKQEIELLKEKGFVEEIEVEQ